MDTYFFIPGNRLHKVKEIQDLGVTQIIIDLEDAVKESSRDSIVSSLAGDNNYNSYFIRIPLHRADSKLDLTLLDKFIGFGFTNFVFPKLSSANEVSEVFEFIKKTESLKIILLIETPRLFLEAKEVMLNYSKYFCGLGIGSHDFMANIGGAHSLNNLEYIRQQILYLSRMINITAIDIASMEIESSTEFKNEVLDGFKKGYDAKFYIHPWQINQYKNIQFYTEQDFKWAKKIKTELDKVKTANEFNPTVIDGQIIERPHIVKAQKILKYFEK